MSFLRNCWYVASWDEELSQDQLVLRKIIGEPILLYRQPNGQPVAVSDICPHRFAPLHLGRLLPDGGVACNYHGLRFAPDGSCTHNPHEARIPSSCRLQSYPLMVKHSLIWIWMGSDEPDPTTIPDFSYLDPDSGYVVTRREHLRLNCDYRLIIDNLLDLSHISFLHEGILGNAETAQAAVDVETRGDQVTVSRYARDVPVPALFDMLFRNDGQRVDYWNMMRWDLPSNLRNESGVTTPGGERDDGAGIYGSHFLTPETEHSTLYFIAAARLKTRHVAEETSEEVRTRLAELRRFAFEMQDAPMLEGQQRILLDYPERTRRPIFLKIDAGAAQAQALLKKRIAAEREGQIAAASAEIDG